jgi:O-antigen ligase
MGDIGIIIGRMVQAAYIPGRPHRAMAIPARFAAQEPSLIGVLGIRILCLYVFLVYSRVLEFFGIGTITLILLPLVLLFAMTSGNLHRVAQDKTGRLLILYHLWLLPATVFSSWPGGSTQLLLHRASRALLLYIAVIVLIGAMDDFMRLVWTVAIANFVIVSLALTRGVQEEGRLVVGSGTLGDPNVLALFALFGLAFWALIASRLAPLARIIPVGAALVALIAFGKTGSRGGLVAFVAAVAAHFWGSSLASKVKLSLVLLVAISLAPLVLPGYIRARFMTFFSADENSEYKDMLQGNDVASSVSRKEIAAQALGLTIEHPIFGIGPGQFGDVSYQRFRTGQGQFINHATHNSYLQISCEAGIPAILLFVAAMVVCLRQKPKIPAPPAPRGWRLPDADTTIIHYSRCALIFIAVFATSLSFAYDDIMTLSMALLTAATNVVANQRALRAAVPQAIALG